MNMILRTLMILALSVTAASANVPSQCQSILSIADISAAMGAEVRIQPVFANGGLKGWRLYNTSTSDQLTKHGVSQGALMTHVCGIPAAEIFVKGVDICCSVDTSREVEVTIKFPDYDGKIRITRR